MPHCLPAPREVIYRQVERGPTPVANDQDTKDKIDHDRLFKELLETFFAEFMELFFPEASRAIDLQ